MLSQIQKQDSKATIDPVFASARGAALLGRDSRLRPCSEGAQCEFVRRPEKTEAEVGSWGVFHLMAFVEMQTLRHENYFEYSRYNDVVAETSRRRVKEFERSLCDEDDQTGHSLEL